MAVKNMGTATMRFKQGLIVEGEETHDDANQLVVTGSISMMEPAGGSSSTLLSSANPTSANTTPNDWHYLSGDSGTNTNANYTPNFPIQKIPIDDGGFWEDEIYAFCGSGSGIMRVLSNKTGLTGDHRLEFMLIGGGNHNSDSNEVYIAGNVRKPNQPNATGYPYTFQHQNFVWITGASDPLYDIKVMVATTGYDHDDDWVQVGSISYHAHGPNHPDSATRNLNQHQFESFSVDITGISGTYYVGLVQDGSQQYNTWAAADINLFSISNAPTESYINFEPQGSWEQGEDGIGFRNNAGFMEYKDEGANWRQFNTLAIGPASPDRSIQFNSGGSLGSGNFLYGNNANVGIGDFSNGGGGHDDPSYLLHVKGNSGDALGNPGNAAIEDFGATPHLKFMTSDGDKANPTDVADGASMGQINFQGQISGAQTTIGWVDCIYDASDDEGMVQIHAGDPSGKSDLGLFVGKGGVGIGEFQQGDKPGAAIEVRGDLGNSGNSGTIEIGSYSMKPPYLNFQRSEGGLGSETTLSDGDTMGMIQFKAHNGSTWTTRARISGEYEVWSNLDGGSIVFATAEDLTGTLQNSLKIRGAAIHPHDDIVTSNVGLFSCGMSTNAFDSIYANKLRGPSGTPLLVVDDTNTEVMRVLTDSTGYIGMGVENPVAKLGVDASLMVETPSSGGGVVSLMASKSDWAHTGPDATQGTIGFGFKDMPATSSPINGALIKATSTEEWSSGNYGTKLEFNVHADSQGSHSMGNTKMSLSGDTLDLNVATADFSTSTLLVNSIDATGDITTTADMECNNMTVNASLGANSFEANSYENANGNGILSYDTSSSDIIIGETNDYDIVFHGGTSVGTDQEMIKIDTNSETTHLRGPILMGNHGDIHVSGSIGTTNGGHRGTVPSPGGLYAGTTSLEHKTSLGWPYDETDWTDKAPVLYVEQTHTGNDPFIGVFTNVRDNDDTDGLQIIIGKGQNTHENAYNLTSPATTNRYIAFCSPTMSYDPTANIPVNGGILGEHYWWSGVTSVGSISGDGSGGVRTNGISFTGTHDACSSENIEEGMIVDSTGELWISIGISTSLPYISKSSTANSKTVYGVVESNEIRSGRASSTRGKKAYTVNALGEGKVWITTIDGEPTNGDYITSSPISGYGQLQADDILHSYTVAKLTESIDWSTVTDTIRHEGESYKKYFAGCTYHCG